MSLLTCKNKAFQLHITPDWIFHRSQTSKQWTNKGTLEPTSGVAARLWMFSSGGLCVTHWEWVACVCPVDFMLFTQALQECPTIRPIGSCSTDLLGHHWLIWGPAVWKHCPCNLLSLCSCLQLSTVVCLTIAQTQWVSPDVQPSPYHHCKNSFSLGTQ